MTSHADSSTAPAHQDRGSCVNVSADATGLEEATFPTPKKRTYSEIHEAPGDAVGANGDVVSTTSKRLNDYRPLMTTTIDQTDSALSPKGGNTTPAARQRCGLSLKAQMAILKSRRSVKIPESSPSTVTTGQRSPSQILSAVFEDPRASCPPTAATTAFKCPCGRKLCDLQSLMTILQRPRTTGDRDTKPILCDCPPTNRRDPDLMPAIHLIATRLKQGGRLIYIGPGAADCLGVLDAAELPRKFSASPASFIRLIAGGAMAVEHAARATEDAPDAVADLGALMTPLTPSDILIGIVTSRSMTYVLAGMSHARALGVLTIGITYTNWGAPGDPGVCECVVECDPRLESEGESSETEKNREIQSVLIKLSKKLGRYTRMSEGVVETGMPDERDKNVAPRRRTGARAITYSPMPSRAFPTLHPGSVHDAATSNQEPAC